ncbi:unnamed protein product [Clonostachys chloroleuca]|uniref:Uncharacterized protein n=1 Tax=Clonostachys chloroleuca TaxID=1926264 RepID=A0AA35PYG9_9HYPO|nr:unnamed protein product [Clonostachys chloroleuca]
MSLTRSAQATAGSPSNALTTPFEQPRGCGDEFPVTKNFTSIYRTNSTTTSSVHTVIASGPGASGFAACQPSQWDETNTRFSFSPGVCPSAWTVWQISQYTNGTWTAMCCSRNFYPLSNTWNIEGIPNDACASIVTNNITTSYTTSTNTVTVGSVIYTNTYTFSPSSGTTTTWIHNAWHISWDPTDVVSLTPSPPTPRCSTSDILRWVPGESLGNNSSVLGSECQKQESGNTAGWGLYIFLVAGLPTIFGLALIGCCVCAVRSNSTQRRRQTERVAGANLASSQATAASQSQRKTQPGVQETITLENVGRK